MRTADTTGSMTREELALEDGRAMGRALLARPTSERAAWWSGIVETMGGPDSYRGLPAAPEGWQWAEAGGHTLAGSQGLAHLIEAPPRKVNLVALCGHEEGLWMTVGRWETDRREACPGCAGQRTTT